MAVDVALAMVQRGTVGNEQVAIGEVCVIEAIELTTQLEVLIIDRSLQAAALLVFQTIEGAHGVVLGKGVLISGQQLHVQHRATRGLETVRAKS